MSSFVVAIDLSLKEPYVEILEKGSLATCHNELPRDSCLIIYHSKQPNRFWKYFDRKIENLRFYSGKYAAYAVSYSLMLLLFPLRYWIPRVRPMGKYSDGQAALRLSISLPESRTFQRWKKLALIKYVTENTKAPWIILTTPSYYLNYPSIEETLNKLQGQDKLQNFIYAGDRQSSADGDFVSGGWTLLSRDAANLLIRNRWRAPVHVHDDISFGVVFKKLGVSLTQLEDSGFLKNMDMSAIELKKYPFVRLSSTLPDGTRNDVDLFQKIHLGKL
jgi:hypothetical protein